MNKVTKKKIIKLIDGKCRYNSVKNVVELYGAKITEHDYKNILKLIKSKYDIKLFDIKEFILEYAKENSYNPLDIANNYIIEKYGEAIKYNELSKKIEINNNTILDCDYTNILNETNSSNNIVIDVKKLKEIMLGIAKSNSYNPLDIANNYIIEKYGEAIKYNELNKKIEINKQTLLDCDYTNILNETNSSNNIVISTKDLKNIVLNIAKSNSYRPSYDRSNDADWYKQIILDEKGKPIKSLENTVNFFTHYPLFENKLYYNEFTQYEEYNNDLIKDDTISEFRVLCEQNLGYETRDKVETAVQCVTHRNAFNPFKNALESVVWDGEKRLETFFIDYIGAENTELNKSMTTKWFYALIKRLYEPGCPFDNMLIVYDKEQGTGKSKIVERLINSLGLNYGYCLSVTCDDKDKDNVDKLNKTWIVAFDEMYKVLKADPEQVKQFVAQTSDQARLSYARRSEIYQRHCVFYGSSNIEFFLKDYTTDFERRYWIMDCHGKKHDTKWWDENLPYETCRQILAEAKYLYDSNPYFNYTALSIEEQEELTKIQDTHKSYRQDDVLQNDIFDILNTAYNKNLFDDVTDFITVVNETKQRNFTQNTESHQFFDFVLIEKIPVLYLKSYIEKQLKRKITTQYLTKLISEKWEYKPCKYNNKTTNCYVKK